MIDTEEYGDEWEGLISKLHVGYIITSNPFLI